MMTMLPTALLLASTTVLGNWTFGIEKAQRTAGLVSAGLAIQAAPGGDHYEVWRNGHDTSFDQVSIVRASKSFTTRWKTDLAPTANDRYFGRVSAVVTDANGDLVLVTVSNNPSIDQRAVYLNKVDRDGRVVYVHRVFATYASGMGTFVQLAAMPGGDVLVGGDVLDGTQVARYSAGGAKIFNVRFGNHRTLWKMAADATGRTYVLVRDDSTKFTTLYALDAAGVEVWKHTFNLSKTEDPRFVDLTVNASGRIVVTAQRQAAGQAGRISVWQYANDGGKALSSHSEATQSSLSSSAGYRVLVGHGSGDTVFVAWTKELDQTAWLAKIELRPETPLSKAQQLVSPGMGPVGGAQVQPPAPGPVLWKVPVSIGRLRGLTALAHGRVVLFGGRDIDPANQVDQTIAACAFTSAGALVGCDTIPGPADEHSPAAQFADTFGRGDDLYAIGKLSPPMSKGATRIHYRFAPAGKPGASPWKETSPTSPAKPKPPGGSKP